MDTECDVDHVQTVLNIVWFLHPPNRPSNRVTIDRQSDPLTGQMDTECDVDKVQTVSNIVRFPDPPATFESVPNRSPEPSANDLHFFSARWTPNAMLTAYNSFEHCTIFGSTESAPKSVRNRWSEQSTGRGLSAFYALVPLVIGIFMVTDRPTLNLL